MAEALTKVHFHCRSCGRRFEAEPSVREDPDAQWHPYAYSAECPECGTEAAQAAWERSLLKAWANATGPKTPEGKAVVTANLAGHPTPEEALRTRFNALKHGLYARVATFFPAKPGRYPHCEGCEHRYSTCGVSAPACLKRAELYLKHHIAFETRDPGLLMEMRSDTQAGIQALINDMILIIAQDGGPRLLSPEWYTDKESGAVRLVEWTDENGDVHRIMKHEAHPLLKHLMDFISKNTMTLADMGMTPKVQAEEEANLGHLEQEKRERESLTDYQRRQAEGLERLQALIERGGAKREPALIVQERDDG
jgi:hypothetical protein